MCCYTHGNSAYPGEMAANDKWRCRCSLGGEAVPCERKATGEDLLCSVCRNEHSMEEPIDLSSILTLEATIMDDHIQIVEPPSWDEIGKKLREAGANIGVSIDWDKIWRTIGLPPE